MCNNMTYVENYESKYLAYLCIIKCSFGNWDFSCEIKSLGERSVRW